MRKRSILFGLALAVMAILAGCGGGGGDGSSGGSGTISMNVTDAKPALPEEGVESVMIRFDEVRVHKSGGGWTTLPVATQPLSSEIDLYQFSNGSKTQFVPPVRLDSGKYTQVRISVISGTIRINGVSHDLEIPSTNLKTDKNFEFDVPNGGAVDITVDFDLSQSIVLTGTGTYQLKPVLHINETSKAATIEGNITNISWDSLTQATVIVYWDKKGDGTVQGPDPSDPDSDEEYTRILVQKANPTTSFEVFWLVPNKDYIVRVVLGNPLSPSATYEKPVKATDLPPGRKVSLIFP